MENRPVLVPRLELASTSCCSSSPAATAPSSGLGKILGAAAAAAALLCPLLAPAPASALINGATIDGTTNISISSLTIRPTAAVRNSVVSVFYSSGAAIVQSTATTAAYKPFRILAANGSELFSMRQDGTMFPAALTSINGQNVEPRSVIAQYLTSTGTLVSVGSVTFYSTLGLASGQAITGATSFTSTMTVTDPANDGLPGATFKTASTNIANYLDGVLIGKGASSGLVNLSIYDDNSVLFLQGARYGLAFDAPIVLQGSGGNIGIGQGSGVFPAARFHVTSTGTTSGVIIDGAMENPFSIGDSTFVVKGATGRVGLGINLPGSKFHVKAGSATIEGAGAGIRVFKTDAPDNIPVAHFIRSGLTSNNYYDGFMTGEGLGTDALNVSIWGVAGDAMYLESIRFGVSGYPLKLNGALGGNVLISHASSKLGVGTSSPNTSLDINGNAQFGSGATKSTFTATGALALDPAASLSVSSAAFFGVTIATQASAGAGALTTATCPSGKFVMAGGCSCTGGVAVTSTEFFPGAAMPAAGIGVQNTFSCRQQGGTGGACATWAQCGVIQ